MAPGTGYAIAVATAMTAGAVASSQRRADREPVQEIAPAAR
jgi:hypothetical protein